MSYYFYWFLTGCLIQKMISRFLRLTLATGLAVRDTCDGIYIDTLRYLCNHYMMVISLDGLRLYICTFIAYCSYHHSSAHHLLVIVTIIILCVIFYCCMIINTNFIYLYSDHYDYTSNNNNYFMSCTVARILIEWSSSWTWPWIWLSFSWTWTKITSIYGAFCRFTPTVWSSMAIV